MTQKAVGEIAVVVGADVSPLKIGLDQAGKRVQGFGRDVDKTAQGMTAAAKRAGAALAAIGVGTSFAALIKDTMVTSKHIENMSRLTGVGVEQFQALAFSASEFGIQQDKLADILKDTNDKLGDFLQTGAGPLADFFENIAPKIGVTVDQFRRLNSAEALQLYISSLEKANVSQAEMTFYLEALASDASALAPLLMGNADALKEIEKAGRELGVVIDEDLIKKSARMNDIWNRLLSGMQTKFMTFAGIVLEGFDQIFSVTDDQRLVDMREKLSRLADTRIDILKSLEKAKGIPGVSPASSKTEIEYLNEQLAETERNLNVVNQEMLVLSNLLELRQYGKKSWSELDENDEEEDDPPGRVAGGSGVDEFQALQEQFATEQELIERNYAEQLAKLEEFRAKKVGKEEEFNELERRIKDKHEQDLTELEGKRKQAALSGMQSLFGDLAGLMKSENKKLFGIGKAAAVAEAVVSGYKSAVSAWEKGMQIGGPGLAAAFTAASLAKTGALVSSIQSASPSGGGGQVNPGGGGVSGGVQAQQGTYYTVNLTGGDMYSGDQIRGLISKLNEAIDGGSVIKGISV